jgi:hypothetical protein
MRNRIGCTMLTVPFLALAAFFLDRIVVEAGWGTVLIIAGSVIFVVCYVSIAVSLMLSRKR